MDDLTKLAIKYKTDKWGRHNYTPYYHRMFKGIRKDVKKVIEIGVAKGRGLRMLRDYFPNAMVYGAEITKQKIFKEDRIEVFECDQSKVGDLTRLLDKTGRDIDIVIDDGSHRPEDQILSALTIMPLLKKDAIYIIEDVHFPHLVKYFEDYICEVVRLSNRFDDRLFILRHKQL